MEVGEYGTYYRFLQKDILPALPEKLQNFFIFMLGEKKSHEWFTYLNGKPETELVNKFGEAFRNMWCTAGFFHAAGKKITSTGEIVPLDSEESPVCTFVPVKTSCDDEGYVDWEPAGNSPDRFIFQVTDLNNYQKAMTTAMKKLLLQMPL